jgi:hypothetical protein
MNRREHCGAILIAACLGATTVHGAPTEPVTISPGEEQAVVLIGDTCPTFSWGILAGAEPPATIELAVYRLEGTADGEAELGELVLLESVSGGASSWTPPLDRCFVRGGRYAWFVRAYGEHGVTEWSAARLFEVPADTSTAEQALMVLGRYLAEGGSLETLARGLAANDVTGRDPPTDHRPESLVRPVHPGGAGTKAMTGAAAIRADQGDATGDTIGVAGISHSPDGVGVAAANQAGGADLLLDGTADAATDTLMTQAGIDRSSPGLETFDIGNAGGGGLALTIDGVTAVTTATDQDALAALSCAQGEVAKWDGSVWACAADDDTDTLGGLVCASGEPAEWSGTAWVCGTDDGETYSPGNQLELVGTTFNVLEGSGSGLDADTLDGSTSANFAAASHDHVHEVWSSTILLQPGLSVELAGTAMTQHPAIRGTSWRENGRGLEGIAYSTSGQGYGVFGLSTASSGRGVYGGAGGSGSTAGVEGWSGSSAGIGVLGVADSATGVVAGVKGETPSGEGRAVWGSATASTGSAEGVWGESTSTDGRGVVGYVSALTGHTSGVFGQSVSTSGLGVWARATADTGTTYGVYGESFSTSGIGTFGEATAESGANFGVWGQSQSVAGVGVLGWVRATSGTNYGVRGATDSSAGFDVYAAGAGTNYGPFTGGHEVKLAADLPQALEPGMVMAVTGEAQVRVSPDQTVNLSSTLPTVTLARRSRDPAVFGVFVAEATLGDDHWYEATPGERFGTVNALGEGRVWVTDANGPIAAGDYLTSSDIPGYAERQGDDLLHAYTLGKAIETVDWETVIETVEHEGRRYRVYLVAVVYTSG